MAPFVHGSCDLRHLRLTWNILLPRSPLIFCPVLLTKHLLFLSLSLHLFSLCPPSLFPSGSISYCTYLQFHSCVSKRKHICHFCVPDCRLQPLVRGSQLYQAECLGKDPQSNSGRAAHPHQSNKHKQADKQKPLYMNAKYISPQSHYSFVTTSIVFLFVRL